MITFVITMRKVIFFILLIGIYFQISAQETVFEEARTIYKRDQTFGLTIHTAGWGLNYRYAIYTSGFTKNIYEAEMVGIKHPKEIKSFSSIFDNSNGYYYGKLNSIIVLRLGLGQARTFISKQSVSGIAISSVLNGGLSLAYAKPVYLEVIKIDEFTNLPFSQIEKYDPNKHTQGDILGKASWFRGFFGGKFYPGLYGKFGLNFESARQASRINSLEVGAIVDAYIEKIPIMANELNHRIFYNLYITLSFGAKKTE